MPPFHASRHFQFFKPGPTSNAATSIAREAMQKHREALRQFGPADSEGEVAAAPIYSAVFHQSAGTVRVIRSPIFDAHFMRPPESVFSHKGDQHAKKRILDRPGERLRGINQLSACIA